jgi:hypothetical protein
MLVFLLTETHVPNAKKPAKRRLKNRQAMYRSDAHHGVGTDQARVDDPPPEAPEDEGAETEATLGADAGAGA